MAYSNLSQIAMLKEERREAVEWGRRAIELAERLNAVEPLVHALNNVGSAELLAGHESGRSALERSLELALAHDLEEHVARAYHEPRHCAAARAGVLGGRARARRGHRVLLRPRPGLVAFVPPVLEGASEFEQGRWDEAVGIARDVLRQPHVPSVTRISALVVIGLARLRRGDPDARGPLADALADARPTGEFQRLAPAAAAYAELLLRERRPDEALEVLDEVVAVAPAEPDAYAIGELAYLRERAGGASRLRSEPRRPTRWSSPTDTVTRLRRGPESAARSRRHGRWCRRRTRAHSVRPTSASADSARRPPPRQPRVPSVGWAYGISRRRRVRPRARTPRS